jgi:hypothetical protein
MRNCRAQPACRPVAWVIDPTAAQQIGPHRARRQSQRPRLDPAFYGHLGQIRVEVLVGRPSLSHCARRPRPGGARLLPARRRTSRTPGAGRRCCARPSRRPGRLVRRNSARSTRTRAAGRRADGPTSTRCRRRVSTRVGWSGTRLLSFRDRCLSWRSSFVAPVSVHEAPEYCREPVSSAAPQPVAGSRRQPLIALTRHRNLLESRRCCETR